MNEWRAIRLNPRVLGLLVLLLVGLTALRFWEVTRQADAAERNALRPQPDLLVDVTWLSGHLGDAALRIVDLRAPAEYQAGHIPGAVHFPAGSLFVERGGVAGMLPDLPVLEASIRQAGIGADTIVVAYDSIGGLNAARLFFALDFAGQGKGRLLDGGWQEWSAAGLPVSTEVPPVTPSAFKAAPQPALLADFGWMKAHLADAGTAILDARSPEEYEGKAGRAQRLGHIPGAISLEWKESLAPGSQRFRSPAELIEVLRARGITPDKEVTPYCQSFARAAHSYFMLRWLGFPRVRGYDGSWSEWGNRADTPIDQGPPAAAPTGALEPAPAPQALQEGLTEAQVKRLLGEPQQVEMQNPCWGKQSIWRYVATPKGQGTLRLVFMDGALKQIGR